MSLVSDSSSPGVINGYFIGREIWRKLDHRMSCFPPKGRSVRDRGTRVAVVPRSEKAGPQPPTPAQVQDGGGALVKEKGAGEKVREATPGAVGQVQHAAGGAGPSVPAGVGSPRIPGSGRPPGCPPARKVPSDSARRPPGTPAAALGGGPGTAPGGLSPPAEHLHRRPRRQTRRRYRARQRSDGGVGRGSGDPSPARQRLW